MKNNNKGFFLAETIVMIALVTTVIAFLYPNISKLYENYNNRVRYHDQTEDLYTLKAVSEYMNANDGIKCGGTKCNTPNETDIKVVDSDSFPRIGGLTELYITKYMNSPKKSSDPEFNKYLHRLKKTHNDRSSYRLIGVFEKKIENERGKTVTIKKYASIKIAGIDIENVIITGS